MVDQEKAQELPAQDVSTVAGFITDHTVMNLHRLTVPSMNPPKLSDGAVVISTPVKTSVYDPGIDIDTTESNLDRENASFFAEELLSGRKKSVRVISSTSREPNEIWCVDISIMGRNDQFAKYIQGSREAVSHV